MMGDAGLSGIGMPVALFSFAVVVYVLLAIAVQSEVGLTK